MALFFNFPRIALGRGQSQGVVPNSRQARGPRTMGRASSAILAEMQVRGLRQLNGDDAWFAAEATAEDFRLCILAALDHSGDGGRRPNDTTDLQGADAYYAFNESWGPPAPLRSRIHETPKKPAEESNQRLVLVFVMMLAVLAFVVVAALIDRMFGSH